MPHTSQSICAEILHGIVVLRDSSNAIQIIVRAIGENLRQSRIQVERVVCCYAINRLPQSIPQPVIRKTDV